MFPQPSQTLDILRVVHITLSSLYGFYKETALWQHITNYTKDNAVVDNKWFGLD